MPYDYIEEYQKQNDETIWLFRDKDAQEKIDTSSTETDYANPLSLETMQAQLAENTKIKIEPIQDLHGYDKPWVGGAGKNLLPMTVEGIKAANIYGTWSGNTYVESGVTFTILTDADNNVIGIKANGTSSKQITFHILTNGYTQNIYKGMIINGCTGGASNTFSVLTTYSQDGTSWATENSQVDAEQYISSNYDYMRVSILIRVGIQVSNKIFYPMLRLATETDSSFAPYSNICPISGHDQIDILGCGKNLCKPRVTNNTTVNGITVNVQKDNGGNIIEYSISSNTATANANIVLGEFTPNNDGQYIFSGFKINNASNNVRTFIWNETLSQSVVGTISDNSISVSLVKDNLYLVALLVNNGYTVPSTIIKPMILIPTETDTTFEPYTISNNLSIDLPSTVYGGVLDLESGELVVDRKIAYWTYISTPTTVDTNNRWELTAVLPNDLLTDLKNTMWNATKNYDFICDKLPKKLESDCVEGEYSFSIYGHATFVEFRPRIPNTVSAADAKTIAESCTLVYYINPITIHLTPHQLSLLKSQNNLTTSQYTQIKVTYRNGVFVTLEELSDTANGIYDEISGDATTVSGNPINFTTREKQKSKSTIIDLEPIQDLHGYDKPWVGGAGKNLLLTTVNNLKTINPGADWSGNTATIQGCSFEIITDSDDNVTGIKVNRKTSSSTDAEFIVAIASHSDLDNIDGKTVIMNGAPSGASTSTCWLQIYLYDGTNVINDQGSGSTAFTLSKVNETRVRIIVKSGYSPSNMLYKPMIRLSSVADSTFEPYTNIASISGRSSVNIDGCGINIWDEEWENGSIDINTGEDVVNNNRIRSKNNICIDSNTTHKIYGKWMGLYFYDRFGNYISWMGSGASTTPSVQTFTTPSNAYYLRFRGDDNYGNTYNNDICISVNGTSYEPYTSSSDLTISFGTTVYGGRLDVEKGELVVDRAKIVLDGDANTNYGFTNYWESATDWKKYLGRTSANVGIRRLLNNNSDINLISDKFKSATENGRSESGTVAGSTMLDDSIYLNFGSNSGLDTTVKQVAWLAQNPVTVVYELATPQTLQLTPQQVQLLKGINNISTTGTTITVTFKNGSVAHLDDLPENVFTDLDKEKLASIDTLVNALGLSVVDGKLCQTYNT